MKNVLRILSATFVIGLIAACSDGGGGGGSAQACNNSSECPTGYECIANSTASEQDHQLSPGYSIQGISCAQFCAQAAAQCGGEGDLATCEAECQTQASSLPDGCLDCVAAQPEFCTGDLPPACVAACTGSGQGGGGTSSGQGGSSTSAGGSSSSQGQGGSGTIPGAGGSATSQGQGGSGTVPGAGGSSSGTPAKTGTCRAKSTQGGGGTSSQGGGGTSSGGVTCDALCQKASGCSGVDASTCATQCPQVSDACRSCINNLPNICTSIATGGSDCTTECTSSSQGGGGSSSQGQGGSSSQGQGGSSSQGQGGSSSSDNTCTLNGTKYNCPSAEAAQQCFDNFAPGSCTPA